MAIVEFPKLSGHFIQENQLTVPEALNGVNHIFSRLNSRKSALDQLINSLKALEIGDEQIEKGACEIGIMIPPLYVENDLYKLSDEFHDLVDTLLVFDEVATGSRSNFMVRSIASSDFGLFLVAAALLL